MEEALSMPQAKQFLEDASEFAAYPGVHTDDSVKAFLDRYPLRVLFGALQKSEGPKLEETVVVCLERVFKTRYGALLIPQYMLFVRAGLEAGSQAVNCLACKAVSNLIEKADQSLEAAVQLIIEHNIYPLLINCLLNGNELVAAASLDAIKNLAQSPSGMNIIFPSSNEEISLKNVAAQSSSLARVRILSLVAKLFSLSHSVASVIYDAGLLNLFEAEISNTSDVLLTLSALELLYELADSSYSTGFLLKTTLLQLLASIISNSSVDPALRTRAVLITGRLLSQPQNHAIIDESSVKTTLLAIDERLELLKDHDADECENALEALGEIGSTLQGAEILLSGSSPVARHVIGSAFNYHGRGKQLAALHALASISGVNRPDGNVLLNHEAEECLRRLIYETAAKSLKFTPSALLLSVLRQEPEIRLAAYRVIAALAARPWCLTEICSKLEIIQMVTDAEIETTKNGMEARYLCCTGINKSLSASHKLSDPAFAGIVEKVQEAVRRGPYLVARKHVEAKPIVVTAERF